MTSTLPSPAAAAPAATHRLTDERIDEIGLKVWHKTFLGDEFELNANRQFARLIEADVLAAAPHPVAGERELNCVCGATWAIHADSEELLSAPTADTAPTPAEQPDSLHLAGDGGQAMRALSSGELYDIIPPSAAEWLYAATCAASDDWCEGWDACRDRTRMLLDAALAKGENTATGRPASCENARSAPRQGAQANGKEQG